MSTSVESKLAVIEGKWDNKMNISVKGLFDILSDINFDTPHAYIYEMFCDANALTNIINRMATDKDIKYLYIGAHGNQSSIRGSGGDVSRTKLRNILANLNIGTMEGLFLGSCLFGHEDNGDFLLNPRGIRNPPIKWIAGYTKSINWIDSSALDILFWNKFFSFPGPAIHRIESTALATQRLAPGLVVELGFCVYTKKKGPNGGIKNLLEF